jgi:hypothetical protein
MNINIIKFQLKTLFENIKTAQIRDLVAEELEWTKVNKKVMSFIEHIQGDLKKRDYADFIGEFQNNNKINFDIIKNRDKLNNGIGRHPILLWLKK